MRGKKMHKQFFRINFGAHDHSKKVFLLVRKIFPNFTNFTHS